MLKKEKMDRINQLARKHKSEGLTDKEKEERDGLRQEYLAQFRERFKGQLQNVKFVEDLSEEELAEYRKKEN